MGEQSQSVEVDDILRDQLLKDKKVSEETIIKKSIVAEAPNSLYVGTSRKSMNVYSDTMLLTIERWR